MTMSEDPAAEVLPGVDMATRPGAKYVIGIDCGGTTLRARLAAVRFGETLSFVFPAEYPDVVVPSPDPALSFTALLGGIASWPLPRAVCIACFGPICVDSASADYGRMQATPKPKWANFPVHETVQLYFAQRARVLRRSPPVVRLVHDVVAPAAYCALADAAGLALSSEGADTVLATTRALAGLRLPRTVYMTVGTGVGLAACLPRAAADVPDAALALLSQLPEPGSQHAELGHVLVPLHPADVAAGFGCLCPFHSSERLPGLGCVEGLAAAPAIAARLGLEHTELDRAELGAEHAVWSPVRHYLAHAVHSALLAWRPGLVVLGGGVSLAPGLVDGVAAQLAALNCDYVELPRVAGDPSGGSAGLLGACVLAGASLARGTLCP